MIQLLHSLQDTQKAASDLASSLNQDCVICLNGPIGAGKTTFAQFFLQTLLPSETYIQSPTFSLVNIYDTQPYPFWHMDLFRLKDPSELTVLGWDEAVNSPISFLIEWPDPVLEKLPTPQDKKRIIVNLTLQNDTRSISIDHID